MSSSVGIAVLNQLRHALLVGEIAPGSKLSQSGIAKQFGVSRIPVRDAIQQLVGEGLVQIVDGTPRAPSLSILELQEIHEMRASIEPFLAQIAAPNVGRAEVIQMTGHLAAMNDATTTSEWLDANNAFHGTIYRCASRPRMIAHVDQLRKLTDRYLHLHLTVIGDSEHLHDEHAAILEAAKNGNGAELRELTLAHLETSHEFIVRYLLTHVADSEGGIQISTSDTEVAPVS